MSAPVTERTRTAAGSTIPAQRGRRGRAGSGTTAQKNPAQKKTAQKNTAQKTARAGRGTAELGALTTAPKKGAARTSGTQKAYARREERLRRLAGGPQARGATSGRAQFALLLMVLLGVGLVATLWLSTAAAADSYRLQDARTAARQLSSQSERLHREVASMESAPELARRASGIGMVPVQDPARLVVRPDGTVTVVGVPMPAVAKAPPVPPAAARPDPPLPADAASQTPADQVAPAPAGTEGATGAAGGPGDVTTGDATTDDAASAAVNGADPAGGPPQIGAPATSGASTGTGQEGAGEDGNGAGDGTADRSTASGRTGSTATDSGTASDSDSDTSTDTSTGARRATGGSAAGSDTAGDRTGDTATAAGDRSSGGTATGSPAATGANAGRTAPGAG